MIGRFSWSSSIYKLRKFFTRDEHGKFAKPVFNFGSLPVELKERILVDVAVTRLQTSKILKEVYDTMATVCQDWRRMVCLA